MSRLGPTASQIMPEGEFKFVLFAGHRPGSHWPFKYRFRHGIEVTSIDLAWPDWLPHIDVKDRSVAPHHIATMHTTWPIAVRKADHQPVPGARVSAVFTNDEIVMKVLRQKGWVNVSDQWHKAKAEHEASLVASTQEPTPGPVAKVVELAARATGRKGGRRAEVGA